MKQTPDPGLKLKPAQLVLDASERRGFVDVMISFMCV